MTNTRKRLPPEVFQEVFQFVLRMQTPKQLLSGKTVGVDSTMPEANAAMKSIVRRDTGGAWRQYVTRLVRDEGVIEAEHHPTDEEPCRYEKSRKNKRVSIDEWVAPNDPDARIKDETRHDAPRVQGGARRGFAERHGLAGRDPPGQSQ